jgi:hypothetical protein
MNLSFASPDFVLVFQGAVLASKELDFSPMWRMADKWRESGDWHSRHLDSGGKVADNVLWIQDTPT